MKMKLSKFALVTAGLLAARLCGAAQLDTAQIDELTGLKGKLNSEEGVYKVSAPRSDLNIMVDGWKMPPFMGLTSWAAFEAGTKEAAMVMGDLLLMQDEVNPVMSALLDAGLNVTALHNHFFYDEPKVYFMHIEAEGSIEKLAGGVRKALDRVKEIRAASPQPARNFGGSAPGPQNSITAKPLESILGSSGQTNNGMFKAVIGRKARLDCGCEVSKEMGLNTWAAFAGTDDEAFVDGDFAAREEELQLVLKSLRASGINIVAIHHHMTRETPRYIFLHYMGKGKAVDLAKALKRALDTQS